MRDRAKWGDGLALQVLRLGSRALVAGAARYCFDANPSAVCGASVVTETTAVTSAALAVGSWYAHVCAVDAVGHWGAVATVGPYRVGIPGVLVAPPAGLATSEAGGTASFTVRLADVVISASSTDPGEGTVAPASVSFVAGNWATEQIFTVTGVDDSDDDGDVSYAIRTSLTTSGTLSAWPVVVP